MVGKVHDSSMIGGTLHIHESLGISLIESLGAPQNMIVDRVIMSRNVRAFASVEQFLVFRILLLHFAHFIFLA